MSQFKQPKNSSKKAICIVFIVISSILIFAGGGGFINKLLIQGQSIEEVIPNFFVTPIGIIGLCLSILSLKNKVTLIPARILFDIGAVLMLASMSIFFAYQSISLCLIEDNDVFATVVFFVFAIGMGFGAYLWYKLNRAHWALFTFSIALQKNDPKKIEKKKKILLDKLVAIEQLHIVLDVSTGLKVPFVNSDGQLAVYDSKEYAQKVIDALSYRMAIKSYFINTIDKKDRLSFFQNLYNMGFSGIDYSTTFGSVSLSLEDFQIEKNYDPIQSWTSKYLVQQVVSLQQRARYSHLLKINRPQTEIDQILSVATANTNISVALFKDSLFYVFVVPDNIGGENILNFSENAYEICEAKKFLPAMSFDENITRFIKYPLSLTIPYIDTDREGNRRILTFSNYNKASNQLKKFKEQLAEIDLEMSSEEWQQRPEEYKMAYIANYRNDVKSISECDICVMTGEELAIYLQGTDCDSIITNNLFELNKQTLIAKLTNCFYRKGSLAWLI